jgi:hypothetical protein
MIRVDIFDLLIDHQRLLLIDYCSQRVTGSCLMCKNKIGGVLISVCATSAADHGIKTPFAQTKIYNIKLLFLR